MAAPFAHRAAAGRALAPLVVDTVSGWPGPIVLALPRGGVPVAAPVADALGAPFDVFVVRKLGVPGHEELAMGAIASGGVVVFNDEVVNGLGIHQATIDRVIADERTELERRERSYRDGRPPPPLAGRTAVLVDDGLATGATMRAAISAVRAQHAARVVVAVPVASRSTCDALLAVADAVVCAAFPAAFHAVGQGYDDFSEVSDDEVRSLLALPG